MDAKTRAKIFEPFFTTKFAGRGLVWPRCSALSAATGECSRWRASWVGARPSGFYSRPVRKPQPPRLPAGALGGAGDGTVLLVDDEEAVRNVAGQMLERCGFTVLCARDGREAVELFAARASEIVCVLLDLAMQEWTAKKPSGSYVASSQACASFWPADTAIRRSRIDSVERAGGMIEKPYQMKALGTKLREALAPDA